MKHLSQTSLFAVTSVALALSLLITTVTQFSSLTAVSPRFGFDRPPPPSMRKITTPRKVPRSTSPTSPTKRPIHDSALFYDCNGIRQTSPCSATSASTGRSTTPPSNSASCSDSACGPQPLLPNYPCTDGSDGGPTGKCLRKATGACSWEIRKCVRAYSTCDGGICRSREDDTSPAGLR